jgi:hypothetical protein
MQRWTCQRPEKMIKGLTWDSFRKTWFAGVPVNNPHLVARGTGATTPPNKRFGTAAMHEVAVAATVEGLRVEQVQLCFAVDGTGAVSTSVAHAAASGSCATGGAVAGSASDPLLAASASSPTTMTVYEEPDGQHEAGRFNVVELSVDCLEQTSGRWEHATILTGKHADRRPKKWLKFDKRLHTAQPFHCFTVCNSRRYSRRYYVHSDDMQQYLDAAGAKSATAATAATGRETTTQPQTTRADEKRQKFHHQCRRRSQAAAPVRTPLAQAKARANVVLPTVPQLEKVSAKSAADRRKASVRQLLGSA